MKREHRTSNPRASLDAALPPGGTAIVPPGFPVDRDDLELVRVGQDVTVESFEPPLLRTSLGTVEVEFTARHLAANALTALATASALGLKVPRQLRVQFTEWRNEEIPLPGGGVLVNDAWNANPVSMRPALEHLVPIDADRTTEAAARLAGADRVVEREQSGRRFAECCAAAVAAQLARKVDVDAVLVDDARRTRAAFECSFDRLDQTRAITAPRGRAIGDHVQRRRRVRVPVRLS